MAITYLDNYTAKYCLDAVEQLLERCNCKCDKFDKLKEMLLSMAAENDDLAPVEESNVVDYFDDLTDEEIDQRFYTDEDIDNMVNDVDRYDRVGAFDNDEFVNSFVRSHRGNRRDF